KAGGYQPHAPPPRPPRMPVARGCRYWRESWLRSRRVRPARASTLPLSSLWDISLGSGGQTKARPIIESVTTARDVASPARLHYCCTGHFGGLLGYADSQNTCRGTIQADGRPSRPYLHYV